MLKGAILAVCSSGLGLLAFLSLDRGEVRQAPDGQPPVSDKRLEERLDRLTQELDRFLRQAQFGEQSPTRFEPAQGKSVAEPAGSPIRESLHERSLAGLETRMEALEHQVSDLIDAIREGRYVDPPPSADLMQKAPPRDWSALDRFAQAYLADTEEAVDSIRFLSYAAALQRFGTPTSMTPDNQWGYRRAPAPVGHVRYVELSFLSGYIVGAKAEVLQEQ